MGCWSATENPKGCRHGLHHNGEPPLPPLRQRLARCTAVTIVDDVDNETPAVEAVQRVPQGGSPVDGVETDNPLRQQGPGRYQRRVRCEPRDCEEGGPMWLFVSAFVGGLVGTGLMDVAEILMQRSKLTSASG